MPDQATSSPGCRCDRLTRSTSWMRFGAHPRAKRRMPHDARDIKHTSEHRHQRPPSTERMADPPTPTIASELEAAAERLTSAGCSLPVDDAEAIVADTLGIGTADLGSHGSDGVPGAVAAMIAERLSRRENREPLEYILGRCSFRDLELLVDHRVLIPEDDSGPLVDAAIELRAGARVHDVGTGSGAIAIAIKHERPDLQVSGSDISPSAIEVASANAARLGLDVQFAVERGLPTGDYDLVVANLPFQDERGQTLELDPEATRYQPHVAVFAGTDGLEAIRGLLHATPAGTLVALKHAPTQAAQVREQFRSPTTVAGTNGRIVFTTGRVR